MTAAALEQPALSPFQERVLTTPEEHDLCLAGGRGGAKSHCAAFLFLRHAEQHGARARALYVRRTHAGCEDFVAITRTVFGAIYGTQARFNANEGLWKLPNGATFEINQIETVADFQKFQGRSFSLIIVDEGGQFSDPSLLDLLRSCLRAPAPICPRFVLIANPGGPGHGWIARRHVFAAAPWVPYTEERTGRIFINAPSTFRDNVFIDKDAYAKQLAAACATDPELLKAWDGGDWTIARGAFFSAVLDQHRNMIEAWPENFPYRSAGWSLYLAHDFGVTAPSVTYVCAQSPGIEGPDRKFYPRDSVVLLDEIATHEPGSLERGMGYTVPHLAEQIVELAKRWGMKRAEGVADDACFAKTGTSAGSLANEFRRCHVYFTAARKGGRLAGWERMRRLLQDAGKPDLPGLYVSRRCEYFWATVPTLARDPRRPDDVDSRTADHAADAARYALTRIRQEIRSGVIQPDGTVRWSDEQNERPRVWCENGEIKLRFPPGRTI